MAIGVTVGLRKAVDLYAEEGEWSPAANGPGTARCQYLRAQRGKMTDTPQAATIRVALRRDWTKGAMIIEPAKIQWDAVHAVSSEGLYFSTSITNDAMLAGGRGVNPGASS
jgi:hypothetical protein